MSEFKTKLRVESDGKYWVLFEALVFDSDIIAGIVKVPVGFRTDFASVPRIPFIYSLFGNQSHSAAVIHDWLYSGQELISRKTADLIFKEAMKKRGQTKWRRNLMFWAVRLFAGFAYKPFMEKKNANI